MEEALTILGPAFVQCLVLTGLHVYLGMHILVREVIFVDLSLAQLAALGATIGTALGYHDGKIAAHVGGFAFTIAGAALFAFTRKARKRVSQEAIVGIVYAVASAVIVLLLSSAAHGAEQMKDLLVGSLLVTTWDHVLLTIVVYTILGALEFVLARRFIEISWNPDVAEAHSRRVEWWDFLFYLLFGIAVTLSVQVAGVLVVFSFLIVPAVVTKFFWTRLVTRLLAGWGIAIVASVSGLAASWGWDLPTGATVVAAFGAILIVSAIVRALGRRTADPLP